MENQEISAGAPKASAVSDRASGAEKKPTKKAEPKEKMFVHGKIQIPVEFTLDRKSFDRIFKGGLHGEDLNEVWVKYQNWCKINK